MRWHRVRFRPTVRAHVQGMTESVEGVLSGRTRDFYVLSAARIVQQDGQTVQLDRDALIPRDRLLFFQTV